LLGAFFGVHIGDTMTVVDSLWGGFSEVY
jgi:hypothetical protein